MKLPCIFASLAFVRSADAMLLFRAAGGIHPCVAEMRETQYACKGNPHGQANRECNFAVCYTAHLARKRCGHIETGSGASTATFDEDLDKLAEFHGIHCKDGGQGGKGRRNARFDCKGEFFTQFAAAYPSSAEASGLNDCLANASH
mmetsp:Transcript_80081/g.154811  ORF Transcript_80081/g.154811 Transcript_80081/m.154811 type:complete len:146 (+) Transcript_80081:101-538(+)